MASKLSVETEVGYREGEGHINALSSHASLLYELPRLGAPGRTSLRALA